jgi:VCBS repeat-containing protein
VTLRETAVVLGVGAAVALGGGAGVAAAQTGDPGPDTAAPPAAEGPAPRQAQRANPAGPPRPAGRAATLPRTSRVTLRERPPRPDPIVGIPAAQPPLALTATEEAAATEEDTATGFIAVTEDVTQRPDPPAAPVQPVAADPPAAQASGNPFAALLSSLAALFNNQTPRMNPTQAAQSPSGVVSGQLNAVDPDSPRLTFAIAEAPANGTAALGADGSWTYTPDPPLAAAGGIDSFRVTVSDAASGFAIHGLAGLLHMLSFGLIGSRGDSSTSTVTVTVTPVATGNTPPTGRVSLTATDPATGRVSGLVTGSDPDGDPLRFSAPATTAKGAVTLDAATGAFSYAPTAAARHAAARIGAPASDAADSFTVTVADGRGGTATVPVAIPISPANVAPLAGSPVVGAADAVTGVVTGSVPATDADGDTLTFSAPATTAKGTVSVGTGGAFTFTPTATARQSAAAPGATPADLQDSFTVAVSDGHGGTASAAVTVAISPAAAPGEALAAFPGAEGFGAAATGGRDGRVLYVTNLDAAGPGSLQWAIDQPGARYILFKVSGVIDAQIRLTNGDVTIAGQTSPGGITLHHNVFNRIEGRLPEGSRESAAAAGSFMNLELSNNLYWDPRFFIALGVDTAVAGGQPIYWRLNAVNNVFRTGAGFRFGMFDDQILNVARNELFVSGNTMSLYPARSDYQLFYCCNDYPSETSPDATSRRAQARSSRHPFPAITYTPTAMLRSALLGTAGAWPRDPMDIRLMRSVADDVISPAPIATNPAGDALLPAYSGPAPAAPADADADGMPDAWEIARGLDPNVANTNARTLSAVGYTDLEVYLHELSVSRIGGTAL